MGKHQKFPGKMPFSGIYKNMSLVRKMLLGYFVLILLPYVLFLFTLTDSYLTGQYDRFLADEQRSMQQEHATFMNRISQTQGYYTLFQSEKSILNYLTGAYRTESDELFYYNSDIRPLFAYLFSSDSDIQQITVYSCRKPLVALPTHVLYHEDVTKMANSLPVSGTWQFIENDSAACELIYQVPIFTSDFYKRIGYLEIKLNSEVIADFFHAANIHSNRYLNFQGSWYSILSNSIHPINEGSEDGYLTQYLEIIGTNPDFNSFRQQRTLFNRIHISSMDVQILSVTPGSALGGIGEFWGQLLLMAVLFLLLSFLYYVVISSFTRKLRLFSRYISKTDYNFLEEYDTVPSKDEIGQVITSYNKMIRRIRDLVTDLNISEMKKNEANYFALQAQMQPHFLYNSLETSRMMAESNDDEDVADFLYNLGTVIRYSFAAATTEVSLQRELDIVTKYLEIYKASFGDSLNYTIESKGDFSTVFCPAFLVQPLVENSIKHGIHNDHRALSITISAEKRKDDTVICVRDNGKGIEESLLHTIRQVLEGGKDPSAIRQTGSGLGLRSIINRVRDYFGGRAFLEVDSSSETGTLFRIVIQDLSEEKQHENTDRG